MNILYNINNKMPLMLRQNEHNMNIIEFKGFAQQREDTTIYFMPDDSIETLIPLVDFKFTVQTNLTKDAGEFVGQLLEIKEETTESGTTQSIIGFSKRFKYVIEKSNTIYEEGEVTDPSLELAYEQLHQEYLIIKNAYESGEFKGEKGDKGEQGEKGEKGDAGSLGSVTASVDDTTGTPTVIVTYDGTNADFAFKGLKGEKGEQGDEGPQGEKGDAGTLDSVTASVDETTGTPSVKVTYNGSSADFAFSGLKGEQGIQGIQGIQGEKGEQGIQGLQGEQGEKGDTPVRGTDYWTEADIQAIHDYIDTELGVIENGTY